MYRPFFGALLREAQASRSAPRLLTPVFLSLCGCVSLDPVFEGIFNWVCEGFAFHLPPSRPGCCWKREIVLIKMCMYRLDNRRGG